MPQKSGPAKGPSHLNIATSVGRSTLFGIIANVAQVVTRAVTVPSIIYHLGLGGIGIWNIIMTTATYMRFGAVGVKTAFQKYVAEATGDGDYERANKLLSTGCAIMLVVSIAGLVPAMLLSHRIARFAGVPPEFLEATAASVSLLAVIMMMSNVGAAFEAIIMGGHRIDLVRKASTVLTVGEAIAIVAALHWGCGLFIMAAIMGVSEILYVGFCYLVSRRLMPQIRLSPEYVTKEVVYELVRFAGSYQLLNLFEVFYASLIPFAILKVFGANTSGVYAVVTRVVASAVVLQEAFLAPILSGGTMIYASGSVERMQAFLVKAFRVMLALVLFPLGFIAFFGSTVAYAWTAVRDPLLPVTFSLLSLRAAFSSFSMLSLVLYRISGKAVMDNVRQVLRILIMLAIVAFAGRLGFYGVLAGMAVTELTGMLFMFLALIRTFRLFRVRSLLLDIARLTAAATLTLGVGAIASFIPLPADLGERLAATLRIVEILAACSLIAWPIAVRTGSITSAEGTRILDVVFRRREAFAAPSVTS